VPSANATLPLDFQNMPHITQQLQFAGQQCQSGASSVSTQLSAVTSPPEQLPARQHPICEQYHDNNQSLLQRPPQAQFPRPSLNDQCNLKVDNVQPSTLGFSQPYYMYGLKDGPGVTRDSVPVSNSYQLSTVKYI
jgi:hypothetical protein